MANRCVRCGRFSGGYLLCGRCSSGEKSIALVDKILALYKSFDFWRKFGSPLITEREFIRVNLKLISKTYQLNLGD